MAADFEALIDLAISRGYTHSQVLTAIRTELLEHLKANFPNLPIGLDVVVNTQTGTATVNSESKDITPKQFLADSASLSRMAVIKLITPTESTTKFSVSGLTLPKISIDWLLKVLFWGYNGLSCLYLLLLFFGIVTSGFRFTAIGLIAELNFFALLVLILSALIPFAAVIYTLKHKLSSHQTAALFVLWQIPTTIILTFCSLFLTQTTPLLALGSLLLLFVPVYLYSGYTSHEEPATSTLSYIVKQLVLLVSVYATLIISLLTPLLIGNYFNWVADNNFFIFDPPITIQPYERMGIEPQYYDYNSYRSWPEKLMLAGFATAGFAVVLLISFLPFLVVYKISLSALRARNNYIANYGKPKANRLLLIILILLLCLGFAGSRVGVNPLAGDLQKFSKADNFQDKQELATRLLPQQSEIQTLIRNASNTQENFFRILDVKQEYTKTFSMAPALATLPDILYLALTQPLVPSDSVIDYSTLQNSYFELFDQSYYADPALIQPATPSTQVQLVSRTVTASPADSGLTGLITTVDEYQNLGFNLQEVVYEFSLPIGSVISDLKLGPNLEFPGQIAPRGAAETVYVQEMNRRRDPALIEQIGSNHYRLRVYPVPSKSDTQIQGTRLKVSWSYITGNTSTGLPLPVYTSTTNLKIDQQTLITGYQINSDRVPQTFSCKDTSYSGFSLRCSSPLVLNDLKAAVLIDVSRSAKDFDQYPQLSQLSSLMAPGSQVDYYRFNSQLSQPEPDLPQKSDLIYFGKSNIANILPKLKEDYELVFIFTPALPDLPEKTYSHLYFIHPKNKFPAYSQETSVKLLNSTGLATISVDEALKHFMLSKPAVLLATPVGDSLELVVPPSSTLPSITPSDNTTLDSISARFVINRELATNTAAVLKDLRFLDGLHNLAKQTGIVTLVSSNIALVNSTQQQNLDLFSTYYNRYEDTAQPQTATSPFSNRIEINRPLGPLGSSGGGLFNIGGVQEFSLGSPGVGVSMRSSDQSFIDSVFYSAGLVPMSLLGLILVVFLPYFLLRRKK